MDLLRYVALSLRQYKVLHLKHEGRRVGVKHHMPSIGNSSVIDLFDTGS